MAIISAGVVMNVIFAFAVAVAAYKLGVKENPCIVGRLLPGDPAWTAGLRPGDKIIRIGDIENPRFRDLQQRVALGDNLDKGVKFVVERDGSSEPIEFTIYPDPTGLAPRIGILSASTTQLAKPPVVPVAPLGGKDEPIQARRYHRGHRGHKHHDQCRCATCTGAERRADDRDRAPQAGRRKNGTTAHRTAGPAAQAAGAGDGIGADRGGASWLARR